MMINRMKDNNLQKIVLYFTLSTSYLVTLVTANTQVLFDSTKQIGLQLFYLISTVLRIFSIEKPAEEIMNTQTGRTIWIGLIILGIVVVSYVIYRLNEGREHDKVLLTVLLLFSQPCLYMLLYQGVWLLLYMLFVIYIAHVLKRRKLEYELMIIEFSILILILSFAQIYLTSLLLIPVVLKCNCMRERNSIVDWIETIALFCVLIINPSQFHIAFQVIMGILCVASAWNYRLFFLRNNDDEK